MGEKFHFTSAARGFRTPPSPQVNNHEFYEHLPLFVWFDSNFVADGS